MIEILSIGREKKATRRFHLSDFILYINIKCCVFTLISLFESLGRASSIEQPQLKLSISQCIYELLIAVFLNVIVSSHKRSSSECVWYKARHINKAICNVACGLCVVVVVVAAAFFRCWLFAKGILPNGIESDACQCFRFVSKESVQLLVYYLNTHTHSCALCILIDALRIEN